MEKIGTIIVDDEREAREGVKLLLQQDEEIEIVAVCANGIEAIQAIRDFHPKLLFLDIQMPQINGFEVLRSIAEEHLPAIIFTTAYDEYTLKAFEVHAVDYLLKPFSDQRFYAALAHAKQLIQQKQLAEQPEVSLAKAQTQATNNSQLIQASDAQTTRLVFKVDGRVHFLDYSDIIWIEAYDYYVKIHVQERFYLLRERLKSLEDQLPSPPFMRIHKSSIINRQHLRQIAPQSSGSEYQLTLSNGTELKSSRSYRDKIRSLMPS